MHLEMEMRVRPDRDAGVPDVPEDLSLADALPRHEPGSEALKVSVVIGDPVVAGEPEGDAADRSVGHLRDDAAHAGDHGRAGRREEVDPFVKVEVRLVAGGAVVVVVPDVA